MLSSQEEQAERRRVLANDQRVKEQSGTFLSHTHMDEGGRFAQVSSAQIVGQTAAPSYPAASSPWQIQLPDEPPLGFDNPALGPLAASPAQATGPTPADAPFANSGDADVGPLSHSGDPAVVQAGHRDTSRKVGSPEPYRRI